MCVREILEAVKRVRRYIVCKRETRGSEEGEEIYCVCKGGAVFPRVLPHGYCLSSSLPPPLSPMTPSPCSSSLPQSLCQFATRVLQEVEIVISDVETQVDCSPFYPLLTFLSPFSSPPPPLPFFLCTLCLPPFPFYSPPYFNHSLLSSSPLLFAPLLFSSIAPLSSSLTPSTLSPFPPTSVPIRGLPNSDDGAAGRLLHSSLPVALQPGQL